MLNKIYFKNGHITKEAFNALNNNLLNEQDKIFILAHIDSCDVCMEMYIESITEDTYIEPKDDLEEKIIRRIHSEYTNKKENKILAIKFFKLAVAVCLTMVIFFGGVFNFLSKTVSSLEISVPNEHKKSIYSEMNDSDKPKKSVFSEMSNNFNEGFYKFADLLNGTKRGDDMHESKQ